MLYSITQRHLKDNSNLNIRNQFVSVFLLFDKKIDPAVLLFHFDLQTRVSNVEHQLLSKVTYFKKRNSPKNKEQCSQAIEEMTKGVRQSWGTPVVSYACLSVLVLNNH